MKLTRRWRSDTNAFYSNTNSSSSLYRSSSISMTRSSSTMMSTLCAWAVLISKLSSNADSKIKQRTLWISIGSWGSSNLMISKLWDLPLTHTSWDLQKSARVDQTAWSLVLVPSLQRTNALCPLGIMVRLVDSLIAIRGAVLDAIAILVRARSLINVCVFMQKNLRLLRLVDRAHSEQHYTQPTSHVNCAQERSFRLA